MKSLIRAMAIALAALAPIATSSTKAQDAPPTTLEEAGGMEALIAKAKAEGGVLLYGAPSADKITLWVKAFQDKYGIPVQYYRAPTNPLYQRFVQEAQVGRVQADLISVSDLNVLKDAVSKKLVTGYTPSRADDFVPETVIPGMAYPLYITVEAVGWNTRVVPEDLQKKFQEDPYEALLDPRLQGKIALVTVTAGGPQIAANANRAINLKDKYGWPYLEKLADQKPAVLPSTTAMLDAVIAGDYWASPDANPSVFGPKAVDGAPIAFATPEVASATQFNLSIANNAPHPYAARLFMEWATSKEAQEALAVITESDVGLKTWTDNRKSKEMPWYRPARTLWYGAADLPEVQGAELKAFYAKWQGLFGR